MCATPHKEERGSGGARTEEGDLRKGRGSGVHTPVSTSAFGYLKHLELPAGYLAVTPSYTEEKAADNTFCPVSV